MAPASLRILTQPFSLASFSSVRPLASGKIGIESVVYKALLAALEFQRLSSISNAVSFRPDPGEPRSSRRSYKRFTRLARQATYTSVAGEGMKRRNFPA